MLDTNMCIYLMRNQPEQVARRFEQCCVGEVIISSITYCELQYGIVASETPERDAVALAALTELIGVAPPGKETGMRYGPIRLATRERKSDMLDKLIAAHATALDVPLVTNDVKGFSNLHGLQVQNWLELAA
ncbi:VapC toxin protein [Candidatus Paraburkholderia calva]|nr:VapC toxin protein [Candidatus Paraburkholderia calva]